MTPLILHRVKNGFLVALHKGEGFLELSEAFIAHDASELVAHIEAHFAHPTPATAQVMVPADAVLATLQGAKAELAEPAPAAQVQA